MIGQTISHYKILEKLGEGGMGVVYKAHDTELDRDVALKFLPHNLMASEVDKARFAQEAKSAAALNDPNICTIFGIEQHGEETFIAMEFVDGKTLRKLLPTVTYKQALDIGSQLAKGLSVAHENGIVHRDIKPDNIKVRKDGRVVIMDFGLAKLKGASRLTKEGVTSGTAGYMSPEQVTGQESDHRADIFSLGVVLYELFAGRSPFKGVHESALLYEIVNAETPPISSVNPEINPELDTLVLDCLAKDPADRCQSAAEVRRKLEAIEGRSGKLSTRSHKPAAITATEVELQTRLESTQKRNRIWKIVCMAALVLAVLVPFGISFFQPAELDLSKYKYTPFATDREVESEPAWSPDGRTIAYTKEVEGVSQVFIRNLDNPLPSKLTALRRGAQPPLFWSPDGNLVYFTDVFNRLLSVGLAGGEPKKILGSFVFAPTITPSPNEHSIVYLKYEELKGKDSTKTDERQTLFVASLNDTSRRKYRPILSSALQASNFLRFSPDGSKLGLSNREGFWILPWPDGDNAKLAKAFEAAQFKGAQSFSWMPDSRHVVLSIEGNLWIGDTETGRLRLITSSVEGEISEGDVSPDGKRIALTKAQSDYNVIQIPLDGSQPKLIMASSRKEHSLSFAMTGNKSTYITDRSGSDEIWLRVNDVDVRPIVTKRDFPDAKGINIMSANISPDGSRVAFGTGTHIFITSTEGGKPTRLLSGDNPEQMSSWSSDGKYLAVEVWEGSASRLAIVRVGAQEPPRFIYDGLRIGNWLNWSPDGKWIAYGYDRDIVLVSTDDGKEKRIPSPEIGDDRHYLLVWSKDGSTIYVASSVGKGALLHAVDVKSGKSRNVAEYSDEVKFQGPARYTLFGCLTPDGKSFVTTVVAVKSDIWLLEGFPQK
jgi:serine/threonine protein kinase